MPLALLAAVLLAGPPRRAVSAPVTARMLTLPLAFERNDGQFDPRVRFAARTGGATVFLTPTEAIVALPARPADRKPAAALRMRLIGAAGRGVARGEQKQAGIVNYLIGRDPKRWRTRIPTYRSVRFAGVYPGADLVYYGNPGGLEYDFVLRPGADPSRIRIAFTGADSLRVGPGGSLIARTPAGDVVWRRPVAYQISGGRRVPVACRYAPAPDARSVGFRLTRYDRARPLIVDPSLVYSTYLGAVGSVLPYGVGTDSAGAAYITGSTTSTSFPVTSGAYASSYGGGSYDAFVAKVNPVGSALEYATYLGGSNTDLAYAVAVGTDGSAYITGSTQSSDFPTTAGAAQTANHGGGDAFVTRLNATGTGLVYSTYLGGTGADSGAAIAVDSAGSAFVGGQAGAAFPVTTGAYQTTLSGATDGFVTRLGSAGEVTWATFIGGTGIDQVMGLALSSAGAVYVTGQTLSTNYPTTAGAAQTTSGGGLSDAFVSVLNSAGSALTYSTLLGGSADDAGYAVAADPADNAWVTGYTSSTNFPTTATGTDRTLGGSVDAFVTRVRPVASSPLTYSTYLGGTGSEYGRGIVVSSGYVATVAGYTTSTGFPTTTGAIQTVHGGGANDAFYTQYLSTTGVQYSTLLGGSGADSAYALCATPSGDHLIVGRTASTAFPTTTGAYQTTLAGTTAGFAARIGSGFTSALAVADLTADPGSAVSLSATLTAGGIAVPDKAVSFTVDGAAAGAGTTDAAGVATASWTIPGETLPGAHAIGASFAAAAPYLASTGSGTLTVNLYPTGVTVADRSGEIGAAITLSATLTSGGSPLAGRTVAFTAAGAAAGSAVTGADGVAALAWTIPADALVGTATIGATAASDATHAAGSGTGTLTITGHPTALTAADATGEIGAAVTLSATLTGPGSTALAGRTVDFTVDSAPAGSATTSASGVATLSYTIPAGASGGPVAVGAAFAGDTAHAASAGAATLTVTAHPSTLAVADVADGAGNTVTLSATLTSGGAGVAGRTVSFTVAGADVGTGTTSASGVATRTYTIPADATIGTQTIGAAFAGDSRWLASSGSGTLTVQGVRAGISVAGVSGEIGAAVTLSATLSYGGAGLPGRVLTFTVDGAAAGSGTTDASGVATCPWTIPADAVTGTQTITASFAGGEGYTAASANGTLTVTGHPTALAAADAAGEIGATVTLSATLTASGVGLEGRTVSFTVGGAAAGSATTDAAGAASLTYAIGSDATVGSRAIAAAFAGDTRYGSATGGGTLRITGHPTALAVGDAAGRAGRSVTLSATLTAAGSPVAGGTVAFTVGGADAGSGTTDASGVATVSYLIAADATVGAVEVAAAFAGDSTRTGAAGKGTLTVREAAAMTQLYVPPVTGGYLSTVTIGAHLYTAATHQKLVGRTVGFTLDGVSIGSATTQASPLAGQAYVSLSITSALGTGAHTIGASFQGDADYGACGGAGTLTVTGAAVRLDVADVTGSYDAYASIRAVLTYNGGYVVGRSLTFKVDETAITSGVTNAGGVVNIPWRINVAAGVHQLTTEFAGDSTYQAITTTSKLTVTAAATTILGLSNLTVYGNGTNRLSATLQANRTQSRLAGRTIAFAIGGVSCGEGTTNAAGVASCSFTHAVPADLGTHTIAAAFAGDGFYASASSSAVLTVKRIPGALAVRDLTVTRPITGASLIQAVLTPSVGARITGESILFKVDGTEIGTAATDAMGLASLSWTPNLAAGDHAITADYAGSDLYDPVSGTGTLRVVKDGVRLYVPMISKTIGESANLGATFYSVATGAKISGRRINFAVNGTDVGWALTVGGVAALPYRIAPALGVGTHTVTASFAGNDDYAAASADGVLQVSKGATRMTGSDVLAALGDDAYFVATLTHPGGYAVGRSVGFLLDGTQVLTITTDAAGRAIGGLSTTGLTTGSHTLKAVFAGDSVFLPSSCTNTLTIGLPASVVKLAAPTPVRIGQTVSIMATVRAKGELLGRGGKTVTFYLDGASLGSAVTAAGTLAHWASIDVPITSSVTAGDHTVTAVFAGDTELSGDSASATMTVTLARSYLSVPDVTLQRGTSAKVWSTLSRDGGYCEGRTVRYLIDGAAAATATTDAQGRAGGTLATSALTVGLHTLRVEFDGDTTYQASSAESVLTVGDGDGRDFAVMRISAVPVASIRDTIQVTARIAPASAPVDFMLGKLIVLKIDGVAFGSATTAQYGPPGAMGPPIAIFDVPITTGMAIGDHALTVEFAGDTGYHPATASRTLTVEKAVTGLSVTNVAVGRGERAVLRATLTVNGGYVANGTVRFLVDGVAAGEAVSDTQGRVSVTRTTADLTVGSHVVRAEYDGGPFARACSGEGQLSVGEGDGKEFTVTTVGAPATAALFESPSITVRVAPPATPLATIADLLVTLKIDGVTFGTATTVGGYGIPVPQAVFTVPITPDLGVGDHTVTAEFAGSSTLRSSSASKTMTVERALPWLNTTDITVRRSQSAVITGILSRNGGYCPGRTLALRIDGVDAGTAITNTGGRGAFVAAGSAYSNGVHAFEISFAGDALFKPRTVTGTLTILP